MNRKEAYSTIASFAEVEREAVERQLLYLISFVDASP